MLSQLKVESKEYQSKQEMYESEFNLVVIYLIELEENKNRKNEGKEKDRCSHFQLEFTNLDRHEICHMISICHSHFQLEFANLDWHERCQMIAI